MLVSFDIQFIRWDQKQCRIGTCRVNFAVDAWESVLPKPSLVCKNARKHNVQSTLVISKSKGPSETLWDIRTSTYQICRIEENTYWTTKFHKWTYNLTPLVRNIYWKYCGRGEQFLLLFTIFSYLMLDFYVKTRIGFSLQDKRLFKITEVGITRVDCISILFNKKGSGTKVIKLFHAQLNWAWNFSCS